MEKDELRRIMLSRIKGYERKKEAGEEIVKALMENEEYIKADTILAFSPLMTEPDISCLLLDGRILLPYIEDGEMKFSRGKAVKSSLGVKLVRDGKEEDYERAVILTPLLAYDSSNYRLGRGGGYYDRYIRKNRHRLYSIGVAFKVSYMEEIPHDFLDEKLDEIIAK